MRLYEISETETRDCIQNPQWTRRDERSAIQAWVTRGDLFLLVVYIAERDANVIITVVPKEHLPEELRR